MPSLLRAALLALVILGAAGPGGPAAAQPADLVALRNSVASLQRDAANLATAIELQSAENRRIGDQLNAAGAGTPVSFEALRQAQFEVDIARTRLLTLQHRVDEQAARVDEMAQRIVAANAALSGTPADTLRRVIDEAWIEWLARNRVAAGAVLDRLRQYQALSADYLALRQEQLTVAQRRINLDALEGVRDERSDALVQRLRALVDSLSQTALALSNEAAGVVETNEAAVQRRNVLRLRSDEELLRSNARLTDVAIVEARQRIAALTPLIDEPAVPTRLFDQAIDALDEEMQTLASRLDNVGANRGALRDLRRVLGEPRGDAGATDRLAMRIANLEALLTTQEDEIGAIREEAAAMRGRLIEERTARERSSLLERQVARTDAAARARMRNELVEVPGELRTLYAARLNEVRSALEVAPPRRFALFGAAVLVLLGATLYLRERLLKRFVASAATRATEVPLEVMRRNLFWLLPVALWALVMSFFTISRGTGMQILTLLAIPAAAASLRDLTQVIVVRRARGERQRIGVIITRAMAVAMALVSVVVFAYAILDEVSLLPSTENAVNRLAYSVFVLGGLPMLLFVFFFTSGGDGRNRVRRAIAAFLSLLPPTALIATGITGLAGYTMLAEVMLKNLSVAIAIAAALALALGILNDVVESAAARIREEDPARAYFVRHNFLNPLAWALQVVLCVIAVAVAARVFGWTDETPGIREALAVWHTTLFTVGETPYSVGSVVIAAAAFVFVFWLAAWCRRIAYTVVFRKLKDIGIRQSLSVFAQYVVIVIGVLLTLTAIGFDVTTLTVFAASLGVGIGFGLQNVVNNFISGVLLLVERPLRIGDIVTVGTNSGVVSQIGIRSMRMKTFDEFDLIVPNSQLISDSFTNWTRSNSLMRVVLMIGISYDDDIDEAIPILLDILEKQPGVMPSPAPMVTAEEFSDFAINLRVQYYVDLRGPISGFVVKSQFMREVWRRFREAGISIPYPQRDVHMIVAPEAEPTRRQRDRPAETKDRAGTGDRTAERDVHAEKAAEAVEMADVEEFKEAF
jgi:potassium efflux system protein